MLSTNYPRRYRIVYMTYLDVCRGYVFIILTFVLLSSISMAGRGISIAMQSRCPAISVGEVGSRDTYMYELKKRDLTGPQSAENDLNVK